MPRTKSVLLLMVLLLVVALVAGCGGGSRTEPGQPPAADQREESGGNATGSEQGDLFARAQKIKSLSFDGFFVDPATNQEMQTKVWIKGENCKVEANTPEGSVITLVKPDAMYTINMKDKVAFKMPVDQSANDVENDDPLAYTESEDWESGRYEDLGQATVDGKPCRVLQTEEAGMVTKLYVWEEWGFPIKVETIENGKITHTMEYRNLKLNSVADSEFELPAGVQVMEMGNLAVPGMPAPQQ